MTPSQRLPASAEAGCGVTAAMAFRSMPGAGGGADEQAARAALRARASTVFFMSGRLDAVDGIT